MIDFFSPLSFDILSMDMKVIIYLKWATKDIHNQKEMWSVWNWNVYWDIHFLRKIQIFEKHYSIASSVKNSYKYPQNCGDLNAHMSFLDIIQLFCDLLLHGGMLYIE